MNRCETYVNFVRALIYLSFRVVLAVAVSQTSFRGPIAFSQEGSPSLRSSPDKFSDNLGGLGSFGRSIGKPYKLSASYTLEQGSLRGQLRVTAEPRSGYWIYSVTQPKGGPLRTSIAIESNEASLSGPFTPDTPPKSSTTERGFEGIVVEKHTGRVTWLAPIALTTAPSGTPLALKISVDGQVCQTECITLDREQVLATFEGYTASKELSQATTFKDPDSRTTWSIAATRVGVKPGESFELVLRATTETGFHIYAVAPEQVDTDSTTSILLSEKSPFIAGQPTPSSAAIVRELIPGKLTVRYHGDEITWRIPLRAPADAAPGDYPIEGLVGYQACTDDNCEDPLGLRFRGVVQVQSNVSEAGSSAFSIEKIPYQQVVSHPARLTWFDKNFQQPPSEASTESPSFATAAPLSISDLATKFCLAIVGGFLLNFMPCVLPVIGLKVLSFVKESDRSGKSIIALNLWYIAGIMTVFLILAVATIAFRASQGDAFGWGQQFQSPALRLGLTIVMFAMALSFLGVWEIPIPGFATSQKSSHFMQREGPLGAYSKGLLTTILSTPCSGPGLAAAFAVAISQPAWVILLMYAGVGLGMSLPFIVICFYPNLMKHVPKPGPWMQSLKEFLAFPMLFAMVWLFLTTFTGETLIAVMMTLIGVWFACWWIGSVPVWSSIGTKTLHWGIAIAAVWLIGTFAFRMYGERNKLIAWVPYSESQLDTFEKEKKTVMVDFTAQWCANCKVNLLTAIETNDVAEFIKNSGVVPMLADYTDRSPEIKDKLHELQSNSIPILAIFPADDFDNPIILRDLVTKGMVLKALEKATQVDDLSRYDAPPRSETAYPISVSRQAPP